MIACLAFSLWLAEREPWEMPVLVRENQNPGAIGGVLGADRQKHAVEPIRLCNWTCLRLNGPSFANRLLLGSRLVNFDK